MVIISLKMAKQTDLMHDIRHIVLRISRVHFFYILAYMVSIAVFDSGNLISHEQVTWRWTAAGSLMVVDIIIWYLCRAKLRSKTLYKTLLAILIVCDILFASVNVFWSRGMASKYVFLYAVPIISAGLSRSRSLLMASAGLSVAAYSMTVVKYFNDNYGQGYRIELWGEQIFYGLMFFVIAWLMMIGFRKAAD